MRDEMLRKSGLGYGIGLGSGILQENMNINNMSKSQRIIINKGN